MVVIMVNRDRHDIVIDILRKALTGKSKTGLMRDVGLSFLQTQQYLGTLREKELLGVDGMGLFKTTKKGKELIEKCEVCPLFSWDRQDKKKARGLD
jgi:predicted transcriptional regulator